MIQNRFWRIASKMLILFQLLMCQVSVLLANFYANKLYFLAEQFLNIYNLSYIVCPHFIKKITPSRLNNINHKMFLKCINHKCFRWSYVYVCYDSLYMWPLACPPSLHINTTLLHTEDNNRMQQIISRPRRPLLFCCLSLLRAMNDSCWGSLLRHVTYFTWFLCLIMLVLWREEHMCCVVCDRLD